MSRVFLRQPLEGVATYWRVFRKDGVTLGFTSHDRDLYFGGLLHRAAPGMLPSAIRRSATLDPDSAEIQGALSHGAITEEDLAAGRFDGARVEVGAVDWETLERAPLYQGSIGTVAEEGSGFTANLLSAKADLAVDPVPRTSPTCRARFCGPGCGLSPARFTHAATVLAADGESNSVRLDLPAAARFVGGDLRWLDGPETGRRAQVISAVGDWLLLDTPLPDPLENGARVSLREGCDHTLATCAARFGNAVNFQGEPFLPGNDFLARYPVTG